MHYRYRWFYAAAISLLLAASGYYEIIKPGLHQLFLLNMTENDLTEKIRLSKRLGSQTSIKPNSKQGVRQESHQMEFNWLYDLIARMHVSGLSVETINIVPAQLQRQTNGSMARLVVHGDFLQLMSLLFDTSKGDFSTRLQDFDIKVTEQDKLRVTMNVLPSAYHFQYDDTSLLNTHTDGQEMRNSFCLPKKIDSAARANDLGELSKVPLELIRMVGYMQQGERNEALVLLPDNNVIAVELRSVIGKEHGVVAAIQHNHILVKLPDGKKWEITLSQ